VAALLSASLFFALPRLLPQYLDMELWLGDWRTVLLSRARAEQSERLALVVIDEESLSRLPYRSPIDRAYLAELLEIIAAFEPAVIGTDIIFDQATEPEKDARLLQTIQSLQAPLVLGFGDDRAPLTARQRAWQESFLARSGRETAFLNLITDRDGVVRQLPSAPEDLEPDETTPPAGDDAAPTHDRPPFALALARHLQPVSAVDGLIDWQGEPSDGSDPFPLLPAHLLMDGVLQMTGLADHWLRGRIVLVGAWYAQDDRHETPFSVLAGHEQGMAGLEIHAHVVDQLLRGTWTREIADSLEALVLLLFAAAGAWIGPKVDERRWAAPVISAVPAIVIGLDVSAFTYANTIIPGEAMILTFNIAIILSRSRATVAAALGWMATRKGDDREA